MKKLEKIVPVALAGLVLTGAGSVEAQAIEEIVEPEVKEREEEKESSASPSTEIKTVTPAGGGDGPSGEEGSQQNGVVNLDVDTDGNELTDDGEITVTETPGETTIVNTPDGDPSVETVTNPDGSSTTTTTQPTTDTTTETSDIEISGSVTPGLTGTPSEDEKEKVEADIKDELEENKKPDGTIDWDSVKESLKDAEFESDGNGRTTIKFTETSASESKPLTDAELGKVLGVSNLQPVEGQEGAYSYTREDGTVVTVTVNNSEGSETATTEWTVTVTESFKTEDGKVENVDTSIIAPDHELLEDEETADAPSASDLLNGLKDGTYEGTESTNEEGQKVVTIVQGNLTYTLVYTDSDESFDFDGLTPDVIEKLLPADSGIELRDGKFYKTIDGVERELTFEQAQNELIAKLFAVTVTITDSQGGTEDQDSSQAKNDAESAAATKAVNAALTEAIKADNGGVLPKDMILVKVDETTYRCEITLVDKTYTYTVNVNLSTGEAVAWAEDDERITGNVAGGATTTVTGSAYVTGAAEAWTANKNTSFNLDESGKVTFHIGADFNGAIVSGITQNPDGTTTVVTTKVEDSKTTTRTYTFSYQTVNEPNLTAEQKLELLKAAGVDVEAGDFDAGKYSLSDLGIQEITWTYTETVSSTETVQGSENTTIIQGSGLSLSNGKYSYTDPETGKTVTFDNKTASDTIGNTVYTYTIIETPVALKGLTADKIEAILGGNYSDVQVDKNGVITAIYSYNGESITVTVDAESTYKQLTVQRTITESNDHANTNLDMLLEEIKKEILANPDSDYYANGHKLEVVDGKLVIVDGDIKTEVKTESFTWIKDDTAVNFDSMNPEDLKVYLESLKKQADDAGKSQSSINHLDLDSGAELVKPNGTKVECVILNGDTSKGINLTFTWSDDIQELIDGTGGTSTNVTNSIVSDNGHYEFGHNLVKNPGKSTYYKVEGKVGYDFITGGSTTTKKSYTIEEAQNTVEALKKAGKLNAGYVKIDNSYYVYQEMADLTAYGYMSKDFNNCRDKNNRNPGYDLFLDELTLLENGRVIGSNTQVVNYKVKLDKTDSSTVTGTSLLINKLTTDTSTTGSVQDGGSAVSGSYKVTLSKDVKQTVEEKDEYRFKGTGSSSYDSYKTWAEKTSENYSSASGVQFSGSLNYHYQVPDAPQITVEGETSLRRSISASLSSTAVNRAPGENQVTQTTTPAPATPTPNDPIVIPPTDVTPAPAPGGGDDGGTGTATPAPAPTPAPVTDIADEITPLAETADDSLADTADDSMMEIADEAVPLGELPDEAVPLEEIADEATPLAAIPRTGDSVLMQTIAAMSGGLSAAWLALSRKRKED